jgi:hypothetical protein
MAPPRQKPSLLLKKLIRQDQLIFPRASDRISQHARAVATGRITPDGAYGDLESHSGFDFWTHIVATRDGILLFYN